MRLLRLGLAVSAMLFTAPLMADSVDLSKSKVLWKGSKVVGSSHDGEIKIKSADIKFAKGEPASAKIVIDMNTITNSDLKDPKWNAKLVGHLKSNDFFSTEKFKTAELNIKKVQKVNDKFYQLHGDLKIKGKTQPVKLKAEVTAENKSSKTVSVDFTFDRTKFDIRYGSGSFFTGLGDKMISDEVEISVKLNVKKSKEFASR